MMQEQTINIIAFAVPLFLFTIALEAVLARRQGRASYYHLGTALSDVAAGTVFQVCEVFLKAIPLLIYAKVHAHWSLIDWGEGALVWIVGLVLVDFFYYWWHRYSHVINLLWAVHGVHHQSEDYNLAVALRQPLFEPITWFFFYIPMAVLGVPVEIFLAAYALDLLYQFFLHTELVDKLPAPIEWLFNTPSHHRVHHGVQAQYLDKNYGGILVIWDRLFNTFEGEDERVIYGTTVPLASYNPLWANFQYFEHMRGLAAKATSWREKIWVWFAHPAWLPTGVSPNPDEPKRIGNPKYGAEVAPPMAWYLGFHYLFVGTLVVPFLLFEAQYSWAQLGLGAAAIVASNVAFLGLVESKPWARLLEPARAPLVALAVAWLSSTLIAPSLAVALGVTVLVVNALSWRALSRTLAAR